MEFNLIVIWESHLIVKNGLVWELKNILTWKSKTF